ncbi:MAG: PAS domain-containing protein [Nitrospirae bacterium]|nr:PAS domain-containing protein [Nitrospirota bacterium]
MTNEPGPLKKFQNGIFRKWLTGSFLLISLSILFVILLGGRFFGAPFSHLENDQLLLLIFFSAVAISIPIGFFFSRHLTASLNVLRQGLLRVGKGDFSFRVHLQDSDDFEELGRGFNEMVGKLAPGWKEISEDRAKLSAILNGMIEGIIILNGKGKVLLVNPALRRMFSLARFLPEGIYYYELLRHRELNEFVREILSTRQNLSFEISFTGQKETFFQVQASVASVENYEGEIYIVLVFHEITDIKRLERIRKDFVANVSHELRTPLTSIKGYLEALQDMEPGVPDEGQKFLAILLKHTQGMENIVSDLLQLAKIESGKEKLQLSTIPLKPFLLKTVQALSPLAAKKNQTIEVEAGEEVSLEADSEKLSRLLTNLIDNAIKYTPASGKIVAGYLKQEGQIELFVKDTGIGIPPADLDRIFERFYRVDRARSREMGGTGLGLSIVKHIMEAHGGFIKVESQINRGTTFTAVFPVFSSPNINS